MYFDNLTLVSLLVFLVAFGAFVYSCLFRNCVSGNPRDDWKEGDRSDDERH
jgi:hypothetical protein